MLAAAAPGFKPGSWRAGESVSIAAGEEKIGLDIVLEHGGVRVRGVTRDITGGPVAGAEIRATRAAEPRMTLLGQSDQDGRFVLWGLPGQLEIRADAPGYVPNGVGRVIPTGEVVIELTPGSNVEGRVVSAADNTPVADVEVTAVGPRGAMGSSAISDSTGSFRIRGLAPDVYALSAEGGGWTGSSNGSLKVGLAETVSNVTVTVTSAARVTGRVLLRADGSPCNKGVVNLGPTGVRTFYDPPSVAFDLDPEHRSQVPSTSAPIEVDGSVHFRAIPAGTYHAEVKCLNHTLAEGPTTVQVANVDVGQLLWKVNAGIGLIVHMVDEADNPLPHALSWLTSTTSPVRMALLAQADGRFVHPRMLFPGAYAVTPGHGGSDGNPVRFELRDGSENVDVIVRFRGKGAIVATVKGSDSEPIDDMAVRAISVVKSNSLAPVDDPLAPRERPYDSVALGDGRFRIGHLPPGKYRVQAADGVNAPFEASGPNGGTIQVSSGVVNATIVVDRGATIRGRVVDPSGQPAPDTWVSANCKPVAATAIQPGPPFGHELRPFAAKRTISNEDGQFTIRNLDPRALCTIRAEQPFDMVGMKDHVSTGADDVVVALAPVEE